MSAEWTPENGPCFFCNKEEEGYAKPDKSGEYQPCCYACTQKENNDANVRQKGNKVAPAPQKSRA